MTAWFLTKPRNVKRGVTLISDSAMVVLALWLAFSLRLGEWHLPEGRVVLVYLVAPMIAFPIFVRLGLYRAVIRYIGPHALWAVIRAVTLYSLLLAFFVLLGRIDGVPRSVYFINWLMTLSLVGGSRMMARWVFSAPYRGLKVDSNSDHKVIIYGAGASGAQLANQLFMEPGMQVVAFIDDAVSLQGHQVQGVPVRSLAELQDLLEDGVTDVLLAMPSVSRNRRIEIINALERFPVRIQTLPSLVELAQGKVKIEDIRDVDIEDLLGRDSVEPRASLLSANIQGKAVLVTGAGGSIGSELCRQIARLQPKTIILFENNEYALYTVEQDILNIVSTSFDHEIDLVSVLGSVNDQPRFEQTCKTYGVQTIYHAAAYKHVPMVEKNPGEAIRNNTFGTLRCAESALRVGVETFVLISTDKAVRPTNTMGASKRMAELILQALSERERGLSKTRFCMVRFGNVLGSSGSVVPLFRKQIKKGGPVTVTHPDIIRYFMTIPEAAQLVIQAGAMGQGGDVFVLDMGEPIKIFDLAKRMIHLSGLEIQDDSNPNGDIRVEFTGLRPGEKLYEELLIGDHVTETVHPKIMRAEEEVVEWSILDGWLTDLSRAVDQDEFADMRKILLKAVTGYRPQIQNNPHGELKVLPVKTSPSRIH